MIALDIVISGSVLMRSRDLGVGGVNQGPHLAANVLLPPGKETDVAIDPRIHRKVGAHHGIAMT
jgi:hypothetical protein